MIAELEAGSPRDQGEQAHDDAEGALVQAADEPAQGKAIRWCLVVQPLQRNGLRIQGVRVGERCRRRIQLISRYAS